MITLMCAAFIAWPWGHGTGDVTMDDVFRGEIVRAEAREVHVATAEVTPEPSPTETPVPAPTATFPAVPPLPTMEPPTAPDDYQGHLHPYWEYLNCTVLITRAEQMRTLNMLARDKLRDLQAGSVSGIALSEDQMRQRVFELNMLYYEMVVISFQTIDDIAHADAYYLYDVDPPFKCPPENGGTYPGGE